MGRTVWLWVVVHALGQCVTGVVAQDSVDSTVHSRGSLSDTVAVSAVAVDTGSLQPLDEEAVDSSLALDRSRKRAAQTPGPRDARTDSAETQLWAYSLNGHDFVLGWHLRRPAGSGSFVLRNGCAMAAYSTRRGNWAGVGVGIHAPVSSWGVVTAIDESEEAARSAINDTLGVGRYWLWDSYGGIRSPYNPFVIGRIDPWYRYIWVVGEEQSGDSFSELKPVLGEMVYWKPMRGGRTLAISWAAVLTERLMFTRGVLYESVYDSVAQRISYARMADYSGEYRTTTYGGRFGLSIARPLSATTEGYVRVPIDIRAVNFDQHVGLYLCRTVLDTAGYLEGFLVPQDTLFGSVNDGDTWLGVDAGVAAGLSRRSERQLKWPWMFLPVNAQNWDAELGYTYHYQGDARERYQTEGIDQRINVRWASVQRVSTGRRFLTGIESFVNVSASWKPARNVQSVYGSGAYAFRVVFCDRVFLQPLGIQAMVNADLATSADSTSSAGLSLGSRGGMELGVGYSNERYGFWVGTSTADLAQNFRVALWRRW